MSHVPRARCRPRHLDRQRLRPMAENLEERLMLYATLGAEWTYGSRITYSFAPDGTSIGGVSSAWFQTMSNLGISTTTWQQQFQKAAALWEAAANINLVQVSDDGSDFGCTGNQQGDPRFGDIRIGGIAQSSGILAVAFLPPPINGDSLAGDIVMNTNQAWKVNSNTDIESVALHEIGHALGLDHSSIYNAVMYAYYTTVKQTLNSDDTQGMQAVYITRPGDVFEPNNTYQTATNITSYIDGHAQISIPGLDISSTLDSDWFKVVVPSSTTGTMTIKVQSAGLSSLQPRVMLYDASLHLLGNDAHTNFGDTASLTVNVSQGQTYYFRAGASTGGAGAIGAYGLQVNFGSQAQAPIAPPNTVVPEQPNQGGGSKSLDAGNALVVNAIDGTVSLFSHGKWGTVPITLLNLFPSLVSMLSTSRIQVGSLSGQGDPMMILPAASRAHVVPGPMYPTNATPWIVLGTDLAPGAPPPPPATPTPHPTTNMDSYAAVDAVLAGLDAS